MIIPTEPIGSIPRPLALIEAIAKRDGTDPALEPLYEEEQQLRSVALQNAQSILIARRQAEEALRKHSEWLRVTLASIGDGVISTDAEGRVTFMNGVAEALTGWPQAEALGHPLPEVFHIINEQTRQPVENPALRALREGTGWGWRTTPF